MTDRSFTDALEAAREWSHELLAARTEPELYETLVDLALEGVEISRGTVYCFEEETATLNPEATSLGAVEPVSPGEQLVWEAFKSGSVAFREENRSKTAASDETRSYLFAVPFGDDGVFAVGEADDDLEEETIQAVRLLCVIAGNALDRVRFEARLQEHDRKLQEQIRTLERTGRATETYGAVIRAVTAADTSEELATEICTRVGRIDGVEFVWIAEVRESDGRLYPQAWAGFERGYLERAPMDIGAAGEPTAQSARDRTPIVVSDVATRANDERWAPEALERGFRSVVAVPLSHDGIVHGVLSVYADRAAVFDEVSRIANDLGNLVGYAIAAIQRRNGILAHRATELDIEITAPACFFVRFVRETGTEITFEAMSPSEDGSVLVFAEAESPELLLEYAERTVTVEDVQFLEENGDTGLVRGRFDDSFIGAYLSRHGITLERVSAMPEEVRITVSIPPTMDPRQALEIVEAEYPDATVLAKRERTAKDESPLVGRNQALDRLTERQRDVVERAYREGYFETPKRVTGEEVAAVMDISTSAFHNHLRAAESELFSWLFDTE